ncbi:MAG: rhodanese-related sulfurtransferase [Paracoccus sp. (in: a-proteobacteria)]|nr:rhodanese-related sulfurtransferase [Paracoccus sp. (in: a-proteobacteria)]
MLTVAALYHFSRLPAPDQLRGPLAQQCHDAGICGTLLLAPEGVNGTIAGSTAGVHAVIDHIRAWPGFADLSWKESRAETPPFRRMKVRLKREIVTMGQPDIDPTRTVGRYVPPQDWNALIAAPDVAVIDTRNDYEVAIGSFAGAVDPGTRSFREFPAWWDRNAHRFAGKRIAMFCTGGIRCEKSTNYLLSRGVQQVFHLQGGILKYLEEVPASDSLWQGECFVFDQRVSLTHGLEQGRHGLCHACRRPLAPEDRDRPEFEEGVCCHRCQHEYSPRDRERFRERQRQFDRLA